MHMPKHAVKSSQAFNPTKRTIGNGGRLRKKKKKLAQEGAHQPAVQSQRVSFENMHTSHII